MKPLFTHKIDKERTLVGIEREKKGNYIYDVSENRSILIEPSDIPSYPYKLFDIVVYGKFSEVTEQMAKDWGYGEKKSKYYIPKFNGEVISKDIKVSALEQLRMNILLSVPLKQELENILLIIIKEEAENL